VDGKTEVRWLWSYQHASSTLELEIAPRAGAFRVIYLATFADVVYVLHAFQKKTRQTAKRDVDLAASRLREQMARMR